MVTALPSDFCDMDVEVGINGPISWDTETSGLFADSGARVSTTSIAFAVVEDDIETWVDWANEFDNVTTGWEIIVEGKESEFIVSCAWPFDQGTVGKPESLGEMLWPEANNLSEEEWVALNGLLINHVLVAHNAKFDLEKMRVGVRRWPGVGFELENCVIWDTQNVNALLWPLHPTSLKPTCSRLFGKQWADEAEVVKKYLARAKLPAGRWDLMPWDAIGKYADTDARITLMLYFRQVWEMEHKDWWIDVNWAERRRFEQMLVLYRMERRGLPYDEVMSREAGLECDDRAKRVAAQLPFDPAGEEARRFFFSEGRTKSGVEHLNLIPYGITEKGKPQLTAEIVQRMVNDGVEYAGKYAEYNRVTNAASMWYHGYADAVGPDGRLRTCFRQNGTRSSRVSVERVNLQAIPQDYRLSDHSALDGIPTPRQIIAKAVRDLGWKIFELDLAQAELRVGAMFAGCKKMMEMIREDHDLHAYTTTALFNKHPNDDDWGKYRQVGKRGNFSLLFGAGGPTFRAMVSKETGILLDEQEAVQIVSDWNALYPEFRRAIDRHSGVVARRQAKHGYGWLDYINGERRWFQPYEEAHKAFNQRVQGNLGQFGIDWMLQTDEFLRNTPALRKRWVKDGIGEAGLVLTIHDSQVLLLPNDQFGEDLAARCAKFGQDLWEQMFPDIPGGVDYHSWEYAA